jgi:hypothetical protein
MKHDAIAQLSVLTAFQRSIADFLPLLSLPAGIRQGVIDYITKIVGGVLTFGLLAIAFRRKFERKYIHVDYVSSFKCSDIRLSDQVMALTARIQEFEKK